MREARKREAKEKVNGTAKKPKSAVDRGTFLQMFG